MLAQVYSQRLIVGKHHAAPSPLDRKPAIRILLLDDLVPLNEALEITQRQARTLQDLSLIHI